MKSIKKALMGLSIIAFALVLISCSNKKINLDEVLNSLNIAKSVSIDFTLPRSVNEVDLSYTSSLDSAIKVELDTSNFKFLVTQAENDIIVTITATAKHRDDEKTRAFEVTVNKLPVIVPETDQGKIEAAAKAIENAEIESDGKKLTLPSKGLYDTNIKWIIEDKEHLTSNGYIIPSKLNEGQKSIIIQARVSGVRGTQPVFVSKEIIIPEIKFSENILETKNIPFENLTSEYNVKDSTLKTFFTDASNIPYVDIKSFLNLLGTGSIDESELTEDQINGFIYSEDIEYLLNGNLLTMCYDVTYTDDITNEEKTETYEIILDFEKNTITSANLNFFDGYVKSTSTNYSLGISYLESYEEDGHPIILELNDYRLDMFLHKDGDEINYLMPFHLVNLLFTGGSYYNVYYNGDSYYGIYSIPSSTEDSYKKIKTSSLNSEKVSYDLNLLNYDLLAFTLDYYYGLKYDRSVATYYNELIPYIDDFFSALGETSANSLFSFINKTLDDLHTSSGFFGYHTKPDFTIPLTSISQLGPKVSAWYNVLWDVQEAIEKRWGANSDPDDYRIIDDNTAVIYLDGFITATSDELLKDSNAFDTDIYFQETLDKIFAENPNVKNIVVDLSYNTGGNLGALLRVLGYITDQPIQMSYQDPTEGSNSTYFAVVENYRYDKDSQGNYILDSKGNRQISKDSQGNNIVVAPREDINWYFLTSKVTFSAANLMTAIGKNQGFATIIGTTSGGGASSIVPVSLPNGSFFTMSSLNVLSIRIENADGTFTYESIEHGIEPDYIINPLDTQDDDKIIEAIKNTKK